MMNKFTKLFSFLALILFILYFIAPKKPYIKKSNVHGDGLFSPQDYKNGDVIISNIFPNKDEDTILFNPIEKEVFQNFISNEAKYINHCSINYNTDVTSKDHKIYKLIANQNINKGDELTTNYDNINKKFPFISSSKEGYKTC